MSGRRHTTVWQETVPLQPAAPQSQSQPQQLPQPPQAEQPVEVFTDPSGRRRRRFRRIGQTAMVVLALCLGAVGVAMAGGPGAPFAQSRPQPQTTTPPSHAVKHHHRGHHGAGGTVANPGSTSASREMSHSPKPTPTASPVATNPAGHVPPGKNRTPNPKKSHV